MHEELPAARSATGFAFAPAPRRGYPISGSSLLGTPLPTGSPLADALLSPPPEPSSSGASSMSSPLRRPPLPPSAQQQLQQLHGHPQLPTSPPDQEPVIGASEAVQRAIAALEAAALGQDQDGDSAAAPATGSRPGSAAEAAAGGGGAAAAAAGPPAPLQQSRSGSGELAHSAGEEAGPSSSNGEPGGASWRQQRQLGGHRRRSPSQRGRRQKGMFGESYPSPWRDPRCGERVGSCAVLRPGV